MNIVNSIICHQDLHDHENEEQGYHMLKQAGYPMSFYILYEHEHKV